MGFSCRFIDFNDNSLQKDISFIYFRIFKTGKRDRILGNIDHLNKLYIRQDLFFLSVFDLQSLLYETMLYRVIGHLRVGLHL